MVDRDLGEATLVYDHPEEGTVETTVDNEHVVYLQDHWILKIDEEGGRDRIRRIPASRVHYVERTVEKFEEEVATFTDRLESAAAAIQTRLPLGSEENRRQREDPYRIDIEEATPEE